MSSFEKEVLSLLEAQKLDFESRIETLESNHQREINEIRRRLRKDSQDDNVFEPENTVNSSKDHKQKNALDTTKSFFVRVLGIGSYSPMTNLNTETLTMYGVAKVVDRNSSTFWKMIVALQCLLFICIQVTVLTYIITDASWPGCNSMSDCPAGMYCEKLHPTPKCADCEHFYNKSQHFNNFCPSLLGEDTWTQMDIIEDFDYDVFWVKSDTNHDDNKCYGFKHCMTTDLDADTDFRGHCDFVALNKEKMEGSVWLCLIFLGFLWTLPICQDIEEAVLEGMVLHHHIGESFSFPAEILRFALGVRKFYLALITTAATCCLIVSDDISAKNIILNFLAVTFITESDNVLALLILRTRHKELMERSVEHIDIETLPELRMDIFWCRIWGVGCVLVLLIGINSAFNDVKNCEFLGGYFFDHILIALYFVLLVHGLRRLFLKKGEENLCVRIYNAMFEVFRDFLGCTFAGFSRTFIDYFFFDDKRIFYLIKFWEYFPILIIFIAFIGLSIFKRFYCIQRE